jgi:diguanylate cyclase (GGDEF)-like protein
VESFKFKLAAYFSLISLLPLAAAFWGFDAVTQSAETGRADSVLQMGLRGSLATYRDHLSRLEASAERLARDRAFQRALAGRDEAGLRRALVSRPGLRVEAPGLELGASSALAAERSVTVAGPNRRLGRVVAVLPVDQALTKTLAIKSGLTQEQHHQLVFLRGGRVAAGASRLSGSVEVEPGDPRTVSLGGTRYRLLASEALPTPRGVRLAILTPQARIDSAVTAAEGRVFVPLLIALVLIALLAYIEGRSIVRTLRALVEAAGAIARGKLDERVPVKGRDEFAQLGRAFNDMADQLGARLSELDAERTRFREATMRFGEALAATHDAAELLRVIVETAVETTGAVGGLLESTDGFELTAGDPKAVGERLRLPVTSGRENFGTLVLIGESFSTDQCQTALGLVAHAATALANVRKHRTVEQQALVDPLTGLANRRVVEAALDTELARGDRFEEPFALLMIDLDDFKQINDRWGHPFGDDVLREFAGALEESVREIDLAGRWGGEEFAVLLPGTDLEGGAALGERVRYNLRKRVLVAPDGDEVDVTASFGVAAYPAIRSKDALVAAADAALYEAKRQGKDQVAEAGSIGDPPTRVA